MHGEKGNGIVTIRKKSFVLVLAIAFFVGMSATMGGILLIENGIVGGTVIRTTSSLISVTQN